MEVYKKLIILIAEDDDGHAELINNGLIESGVKNEIIRFSNGEELWSFFSSKDSKTIQENNYLLLLDINMPKMDGIEVLKLMKSDNDLKEIPIMMLTTTDDPREVEACYKLGCNIYITKPIDFNKFTEMLTRLGLFIQIIKI
ncbi:response regulator receiver protein [Paludibacter propionicigenes WB4]|uniref:Response regulator receiver protein n=1 Tax=Paludibacter propionicigenes (strain DSM 17365 / JCM 13257 / WB4) TaxID=694427 RepID=E4T6F9_PALPW|nr:response regulator [Paludibacter propionicigenes]ADQ80303.1 response regulator receiver protein [Paludibacter propionicigenes WB4]